MKSEAYGHYEQKGELSPMLPDFSAPSILDVDFTKLKQIGVNHVLIDLDQTLRRIGSRKLENDVLTKLRNLQLSGTFKSINIVTNNYWPKRFATALGIAAFTPYWEGIRPIRKPNQKFFNRVLNALDSQPNESVMIGDKVRADIMGANNAGLLTILVSPRGRDYLFDRILLSRLRERHSLTRARASLTVRLKAKLQTQRSKHKRKIS